MSALDDAIDAVEELQDMLLEGIEYPKWKRPSRQIVQEERPAVDVSSKSNMENASSGHNQYYFRNYGVIESEGVQHTQLWIGKLEECRSTFHRAWREWKQKQDDLDDSGPYSPERYTATGVLLCRMEAFILMVQRALAGRTRTLQETFYNPHHDEEVAEAFEQSLKDARKWLTS